MCTRDIECACEVLRPTGHRLNAMHVMERQHRHDMEYRRDSDGYIHTWDTTPVPTQYELHCIQIHINTFAARHTGEPSPTRCNAVALEHAGFLFDTLAKLRQPCYSKPSMSDAPHVRQQLVETYRCNKWPMHDRLNLGAILPLAAGR